MQAGGDLGQASTIGTEDLSCQRAEDLLALRASGESLAGADARALDAHLGACSACAAVANTGVPMSAQGGTHAQLPAVDTSAYALGREVARGGMGRILEARDLRIGRRVAVKELLGGLGASARASLAARFEREARVTARLQHPGIVPIYEIGAWPDGTPFYSMRLLEGRTLFAAIQQSKTLDERLALLPAILTAAEAIAFAHAQRVIHRDLTPSNIMLGAYGETVVIDWGLAKDLGSDRAEAGDGDVDVGPYRAEPAAEGLTSAGAVIGTAAYMPPEQATGERVDERGDVYALGAILYHVLTGKAPYRGASSLDVLAQLRRGPPKPISEVEAGVSRDLVSIVEKAMARERDERYPSAKQLVEELRRFQMGRIVEAHAYTRGELVRRWLHRHRALVLGAVAVAIALGVTGVLWFRAVAHERDRAMVQERRTTQINSLPAWGLL